MSTAQTSSASGSTVELRGVSKAFGDKVVLDDLDLAMPAGELLALLGPSGCGKTTSLRILAGFESATSGRVVIDGKDVTTDSVRTRGVGIVFQAYSLFPHLTAWENVAYGLRIRRVAKGARAERARELLDSVGLGEHAEKFPRQLSGGQQQRVALARALAIAPKVLLLDEPLSALDAKVRVQLREQIRAIQRERGMTTLLVTHDQEEALTMADRVGVMNAGRIEQLGAPAQVYREPATAFVSQFVGVVNRIGARWDQKTVSVLGRTVAGHSPVPLGPGAVEALVRPEDVALTASADGPGVVRSLVLRGPITSAEVELDGGQVLRVDLPTSTEGVTPGTRVSLDVLRDRVLVDAVSAADPVVARGEEQE